MKLESKFHKPAWLPKTSIEECFQKYVEIVNKNMTICSHKSIQIYNKWSLFIYQNTCRICGKLELPRIRPVLLPQPPVLQPWSVCIGCFPPLQVTNSPGSPSPPNQLSERLCLEPLERHLSLGKRKFILNSIGRI